MKKIKEVVTMLTQDGLEAVRIRQKEREPIPGRYLEMVLECIVILALIASGTVLIINVETLKLMAMLGFIIVFSLIYFGLRD